MWNALQFILQHVPLREETFEGCCLSIHYSVSIHLPFHSSIHYCFHPSSIHALFCFHPSSIHLLLYVCFHLGPSSGDAYKSSRCEPHEGICLLPVVEDMSTTMLVCHPAPPSNEKMELELLVHTFVLSHEDELFVLSANYPQAGRSLSITAST